MGAGFIVGRNGSPRTERLLDLCFEEAKNESRKPIYILVPEKYTYEMEKRLSERLKVDKDPFFRIRVVSFSTLSNIVYTNVGGLKERKISKSARSMLIYKAIDSVSKNFSNSGGIGVIGKVMDSLIELKQNNITVDGLKEIISKTEDEALKYKLEELSAIYEKYESFMEDKYVDTEDHLAYFSKRLDEFDEIHGASIFVDEFTGFTPVQYKVIEKLIVYSKNIYFGLLTDPKYISKPAGIFSKTNITYANINRICDEHSIAKLGLIELDNEGYYKAEELAYLERNINSFNPRVYPKAPSNISVYEFENTHMEVEHLAGEILKLVRDKGYRYKEITVAMRNVDDYAYLIRGVFEDYNIGYFLDEKIAAKNNPIIVLILSILDMKRQGYKYDSVFRYLKSGLSGISYEDVCKLENYALANGIKGKKWFMERWDYPISYKIDSDEEYPEEYIEEINEIKDRFMSPVKKLHESLSGRNTVKDICKYLYIFTQDIGLPERILDLIDGFKEEEDIYKAKEYSQVWEIFTDTLDELVEFIGDEKIGLDRFVKLMEAEFEGFELGIIPPSRDQVFITSFDRMKNPDMRILFMIGINDGIFPANISDNSMLVEEDKEKLLKIGVKFDSNTMSKIFDEQFLVYKSMSTSKEGLVLSYPLADFEGKAMRPSAIIKKLEKIFPSLEIIDILKDNNEEELENILENISSKKKLFEEFLKSRLLDKNDELDETARASWASIEAYFRQDEEYRSKVELMDKALKYKNSVDNLDKELAREVYGMPIFSVSKLEKYVSCPFSYFMNYGLKAQERKIYEFNAMESGIYAHKVLDSFSKTVRATKKPWDSVDREYIETEVTRISEDLINSKKGYILKSSKKYEYLASRINKNLVTSLDIMAEQIRRGDFVPSGFEVEFGKGKLPPIRFNIGEMDVAIGGKIDRVDTYLEGDEKYLRLIDYKSSSRSLDLNKVYSGIQLQLFVYMHALLNSQNNGPRLKPAALLYSRFNPQKFKSESITEVENMDEEELNKNILSTNKLSGYVIKDLELSRHQDKTLDEENLKSEILPITLKSKGSDFATYTKGLLEEEFEEVDKFVIEKSEEICSKIYSGDIDISPYKYESEKPCDFCDYKSVCQFDTNAGKNKYNKIEKETGTGSKFVDKIITKMKKFKNIFKK